MTISKIKLIACEIADLHVNGHDPVDLEKFDKLVEQLENREKTMSNIINKQNQMFARLEKLPAFIKPWFEANDLDNALLKLEDYCKNPNKLCDIEPWDQPEKVKEDEQV